MHGWRELELETEMGRYAMGELEAEERGRRGGDEWGRVGDK